MNWCKKSRKSVTEATVGEEFNYRRVNKRSLIRSFKDEELWAGNRETFWKTFFTRDSIILWTLKMFHKNRKEYPKLFEKLKYSHIKFIRLRSDKEVEDFVTGGGTT
jgi:hypothetical protein